MRRVHISLGMLMLVLGTARAQAQQAVSIKSLDGFSLNAIYYAGETPGPGILLLHQCDRKGSPTGFEALAEELKARGFRVLIPDYRTYGESVDEAFPAGEWRKAGPHMADDVEAAYQFLLAQPGIQADSIGIAGASCGGRHAIALANQHEEVKTLVFMSTLVGARVFPSFQTLTHLPVLCVVSEADPNGSTTRSMEAVHNASKHADSRLQVYEGTAHGTPLFEEDPSLITGIADWFEAHLEE